MKITALLDALNSALAEPFALAWVSNSPRFLLVFTVIYAVVVIVAVTDQKNTRPGAEHGSAAWGDVFRLNKFYMDKRGPNLLLTQHFHIGIDGYKHKHNTNILIVGGSGAGKTRTYGVPNVLECACSMVITDPKAEILRKTGNLLKQKGYEVIVFDLINPAASFCYNPFVYVHDDREVLTLIENLIQNTTPSHSKSSDPFWEKSETALLQALMLYLLHEAPPEEQNFPMVMEMIAAAEVHEDDDNYQSPLDILFERLEMREPDSIACKQYRIFKQAAGKTAKSILVSVGVRLAAFNLPSIAKLTMTDELHLQELGERKIALFCCIPDSDKSLNYLVGMIYTQLIVSKSEFVLSLFEQLIGDGMVTAKEKSILGRCTEQVYLPYIRNGYKGTPPTLQDFYRLLQMQPEPEAQGLALSSELFITGTLNTFARHTNVDTQARIIAYDIRELGEQLMPLGMLVTLDAIYNRVIQNWKKGRRTWIFCDEFYILFRYEYSANFFYKLWKRIRKYNGLVTGLTQNVDELLHSDTARLMLANSEFLVMLNQSATDRAELAKLLNISDNQLGYVTNVPAGCGLIRCAGNIVPFTNSFPKDTKLYKLMSTNPSEKRE